MSLYVGNKKYCVVKRLATNTQDILITQNGTYTPQGEVSGYNVVRVQIPEAVLDPLTVTPSLEHQTIEPQNDGFSIVEVEAVTAEIDENIQPENIKKGVSILGIDGAFEYILNPLEIEPKITEQKISPEDGVDGFSDITVKAVTSNIDANILTENIKKGVSILGVEGSVEELNTTTMTITQNGTYKPESPYNGFSEVVIEINTVNNQDIEIVPTTEDQIKTPEEPYTGFGQVTVKGVTAEVDPNLLPENIKKDVEILGVTGTMEGMAPVREQYTITVDETTDTITKYTPDQGYAGFRDITLDLTWIEEKLQELNAGDTEQTVSLQEITIDEAGEFTPEPGYDGIGKVTVKLDWVDDLVQSKISKYINVTNDQFLTDSISQINTDAVLIRPYACYGMTSVQEVTLTCCEEIGEHAFDECSVESLTIFTPTMCTITETSIPDTIQGIYVPEELVDTYKGDPNWSTFADRIVSIGSAPPEILTRIDTR